MARIGDSVGRTDKSEGQSNSAGLGFGPIHAPRASDILAERVREWILEGDHEEGTQLPSERELMQETGRGRSTVREALRILEAEGLVSAKAGPRGGYSVRRPEMSNVVDSLSVFIRGTRLRLESLFETREAVEPRCAALAAKRATKEDLAAIERFNEQMHDPSLKRAQVLEMNLGWHLAVARASHNELLTAFMMGISGELRQAFYAVNNDLESTIHGAKSDNEAAHERIYEAIAAGDADAAERRMRTHLQAYVALLDEGVGRDDGRGITP